MNPRSSGRAPGLPAIAGALIALIGGLLALVAAVEHSGLQIVLISAQILLLALLGAALARTMRGRRGSSA